MFCQSYRTILYLYIQFIEIYTTRTTLLSFKVLTRYQAISSRQEDKLHMPVLTTGTFIYSEHSFIQASVTTMHFRIVSRILYETFVLRISVHIY